MHTLLAVDLLRGDDDLARLAVVGLGHWVRQNADGAHHLTHLLNLEDLKKNEIKNISMFVL